MAEYIEREQAIQYIRYQLMSAPSANVKPVVHGHWIDDDETDRCKCSVCGTLYNWFDNAFLHEANYCPYCGTRMDEE